MLRVLYPHIFAIGDAADAFGDIKAGHNARAQGELAARNILKMIEHPEVETNSVSSGSSESRSKSLQLERYVPGLPGIKVTLGLKKAVYQRRGVVVSSNERSIDLDALRMWGNFGMDVNDLDPALYE
ncbi:hypothetical protein A0H81_02404 [Grifola frondosa]|uniref:FAD/NAD(P)-binding domain-containing protein n=1 Tax=Grifola frondosa TaxID=5627 RepID=A0A1C7MLN3_GRIFR|nr:hypothetical protein A0H81_02404 [Grifola frondosa]